MGKARRTAAQLRAEGAERERVLMTGKLMAFAARLRSGPRKRESWELPISPHQPDPDAADYAAQLIEGLAGSLDAGIHDMIEGDRHGC